MVKSLVKTVVYWGAGDTAAAEVGGWLAGWLAGCVCVGVWEALRRAGTPAEHRWARDSNPDVLRCRWPRQRVRWCTPLMSSWSWAAPNPPQQVGGWPAWLEGQQLVAVCQGQAGAPVLPLLLPSLLLLLLLSKTANDLLASSLFYGLLKSWEPLSDLMPPP